MQEILDLGKRLFVLWLRTSWLYINTILTKESNQKRLRAIAAKIKELAIDFDQWEKDFESYKKTA